MIQKSTVVENMYVVQFLLVLIGIDFQSIVIEMKMYITYDITMFTWLLAIYLLKPECIFVINRFEC